MTIPSFTTPFIFWRPSKVYGMHKVCITGGSFISGEYLKGNRPPNYPVPAIDYYNSANPQHIPIGNLMEWSIPLDIQLRFRT